MTQAFEMRCYRRLLNISYKSNVFAERSKQSLKKLTNYRPWSRKGNFWPYLKVFWFSKDDSAGYGERKKEKVDRRSGGKTLLKRGLC